MRRRLGDMELVDLTVLNPMELKYGLFGGGGGQQTSETIVKQQLTPQQEELLGIAVPLFKGFAEEPPVDFPGELVTPFDPAQITAQEQALQVAGGPLQALSEQALGTQRFLAGDVLRPETNPALQGAIEAAIRPVSRAFETSVIPNIRGQAIQAGQLGGTRQGIGEGLAAESFLTTAGDISSRIANEAYLAGLDALIKGQALAPTIGQLALGPAATTAAVGEQRRAFGEAQTQEELRRHLFEQFSELEVARIIAGASAGIPGGSTITTTGAPAGGGVSPLSGSIAGAAAGGALTGGSPYGTAIGGLVGLFA